MKESVYNINVLWADDEIDELLSNPVLEFLLKKYNISVFDVARTSEELRNKLSVSYQQIDAVIVDANFGKSSVIIDDRNTSGLIDTLSLIEHYNDKKLLPFYLFTGRNPFLQDNYKYGELDHFVDNNNRFSKNEPGRLFEKISLDISRNQTIDYIIRNNYGSVLSSVEKLKRGSDDEMPRYIFECIKCVFENRPFPDFSDLVKLRSILERIAQGCVNNRIVPPICTSDGNAMLNGVVKFLATGEYYNFEKLEVGEYYKAKEDIMPKPISTMLMTVSRFLQEAAHDKDNMSFYIKRYMERTHDTNLVGIIIHTIIDVVLWYNSIVKKDNPKWEIIQEIVGKEVEINSCYVMNNKEHKIVFCAGKCIIENATSKDLGKRIVINKAERSNNTSFYRYIAKADMWNYVKT